MLIKKVMSELAKYKDIKSNTRIQKNKIEIGG